MASKCFSKKSVWGLVLGSLNMILYKLIDHAWFMARGSRLIVHASWPRGAVPAPGLGVRPQVAVAGPSPLAVSLEP